MADLIGSGELRGGVWSPRDGVVWFGIGACRAGGFGGEGGRVGGRARIFGVINATPDSFFSGNRWGRGAGGGGVEGAVGWGVRAVEEGADGLDVGGESTRPGAGRVGASEQIDRVVPVIRGLRDRLGGGVVLSVDTTLGEVAEAAWEAGADVVNDVSGGLEDPGLFEVVRRRGLGLVLMHRLRVPGEDSFSTAYAAGDEPVYSGGVVAEVGEFLRGRVEAAVAAGIGRDRVLVDPGLGFGKTVSQNAELVVGTGRIGAIAGCGVMSALSRKSFVGALSGGVVGGGEVLGVEDRLEGTLALSVVQMLAGALVFRVHDVLAHRRALDAAWWCVSG